MSKPQPARNRKWITLAEALALSGADQEEFQRCAVAGDIVWRWRTADWRAKYTEYQAEGKRAWMCGAVDWEDGTICLEPPGASAPKGSAAWKPLEFMRTTVLECFGVDPDRADNSPPKKGSGGRRPVHAWERALLGVFGQIYHGEVNEPERLADAERLLSEWFIAEYNEAPSESQIRDHAKLLFKEIRRG